MAKINHLKGIESRFVETNRLRMHVLTAGESTSRPILFLHGNTSSSTIWEELMLSFSNEYFCVAPDLRGFGQTDRRQVIDATQGIKNWMDDIEALIEKLQLQPVHLVGHSLGGFICWGLIAHHAQRLHTVTLIAPGPPMGFGGIQGKEGIPNNEHYSGSGGGIVVKEFADRIKANDRSTKSMLYSPRNAMNRLFWKEGYRADREEDILSAMLDIHSGDQQYPGDYTSSEFWPGIVPGKYGPVNALSPKYNESLLREFTEVKPKPPLLWIQGTDDHIISDQSYSDPGFQGKMNLLEGWPGDKVFPPQPMISQIRYALGRYQSEGGKVQKKMIGDCGHTPFIEQPESTKKALLIHIND